MGRQDTEVNRHPQKADPFPELYQNRCPSGIKIKAAVEWWTAVADRCECLRFAVDSPRLQPSDGYREADDLFSPVFLER